MKRISRCNTLNVVSLKDLIRELKDCEAQNMLAVYKKISNCLKLVSYKDSPDYPKFGKRGFISLFKEGDL